MLRVFLFFCVLIFSFFTVHAAEEIKPDYTLMIPMRDGVALPTDLYLPNPDAKNLPCILLRGPAGRCAQTATMFIPLAKLGYSVAVQDTRSAIDSEGKTLPFLSDGWGEQQDGFDTVQWLAKHPATNGIVGTLGYSNMGITQLLLAPTAPEGLACQYIGVAAPSLYHHAIYPGGQFSKNQVEGWLGLVARHPSVLDWVRSQHDYNEIWDSVNALPHSHRVHVPALHLGGWYDTFIQGTLDAFISRQREGGEGAKGTQKLVIGPWAHQLLQTTRLGDFAVPHKGYEPPYDISPKSWFDFHLKGIQNQVEALPPVLYYVMGPFDGSPSSGNRWRTSDRWPVSHMEMPFYLSEDKHLVLDRKAVKPGVVSYPYRPEDLVPTVGGRNLFLESGPKDQRSIETRPDVVVFTSDFIDEDLEITGRVIAHLVISSERNHADVALRLCDVYPDGRSILIAEGLTQVGKVSKQEVTVDLLSTSLVFAKGHRIRVSISGSNFPRSEGSKAHIAGNDKMPNDKIHMDANKPSRIILPSVRKGERWLSP